jgi:cell fate regulator YaaT (PSP1 superfamily)
MEFRNVVGVQFRRAGKVYDFDGGEFNLKVGDSVVVDTERGPSLAQVARLRYIGSEDLHDGGLKKIVRPASDKDIHNRSKMTEEEALHLTRDKVKMLQLDMHALKAEIQFSGNKTIIYFSAPGRVDFRDLVKELATALRARVELKQVGARDEAKLIGGMGICGLEFCCSSFLREFVPVSIKMAKNQNLALNPTKISGGCGRLLCCLTYEDDTYTALRKLMPPKGVRVQLQDGTYGDVIKSDFMNQLVQVELEDGSLQNIKVNMLVVVEKDSGVVEDEWADDIDFEALKGIEDEPSSGKSSSTIKVASEDQRNGPSQERQGNRHQNRSSNERSQRHSSNRDQRPRQQRNDGPRPSSDGAPQPQRDLRQPQNAPDQGRAEGERPDQIASGTEGSGDERRNRGNRNRNRRRGRNKNRPSGGGGGPQES